MVISKQLHNTQYLPVNAGIAIIFIGALLLRLSIVYQPLPFLIANGPLLDDSFISLGIARHISRGLGPTLDGHILTTGYQPLWVFLSVPIFRFFPREAETAVRILLYFQAILSWVCAFILYRIVCLLRSRKAAFTAAMVWLFNPLVLRHTLNGLETVLTALFFMLCLYYLVELGLAHRPSNQTSHPVGLLCSLALLVFSRIDMLILLPFGCAYLAFVTKKVHQAMRTAIIALIPLAMWFLYNWYTCGLILPESGEAVRLISLEYGTRFSLFKNIQVNATHFSPLYLLSNGYYSLLIFEKYLRYLLDPLLSPFMFQRDPSSPFMVFPGLLTLLFGVTIIFHQRGATSEVTHSPTPHAQMKEGIVKRNMRMLFLFLSAFSLCVVGAYNLIVFGQWFYHRYFFPLFILLILLTVLLGSDFYKRACSSRVGTRYTRVTAILIITVLVGHYFFQSLHFFVPVQKPVHYLKAVQWIERNIPPNDIIGCGQAGIISFFSERHRVICLDGVVNREARQAIRKRQMMRYLNRKKINTIIDWPWVINALILKNMRNSGTPSECHPVKWRKSLIPSTHFIVLQREIAPKP